LSPYRGRNAPQKRRVLFSIGVSEACPLDACEDPTIDFEKRRRYDEGQNAAFVDD
jgi:hypothetical protein